jgi:pimeloyl-ACP methyl ester carboxylesterase
VILHTPRMRTWYRAAGSKDGRPVLFIHGNASNSSIWNPILREIPHGVHALAPDMRMYGMSDKELKLNPKRGLADWAEDLEAFLVTKFTPQKPNLHIVGHSLGGLVALRLLANQNIQIDQLTLYAPPPPDGYFTKGPDPAFVKALTEKNREAVRTVVNMTFWHPSYQHPDIDQIVDAVLDMQVGPGAYPEAIVEAVSPARNVGMRSTLLSLKKKPPITWVYGNEDVLVSNNRGGPTNDKMVDDMRSFLVQYAIAGGSFTEIAYERCGHAPFLEILEEQTRFLSGLQALGT